jgi:hypothetical protein
VSPMGLLDASWNRLRLTQDGSAKWWWARHVLLSAAAAAVGFILSVSAWFELSLREDRLAVLEFNARANDHALILQDSINAYLNRIVALRALYEARVSVGREEFDKFAHRICESRPPSWRSPGYRASRGRIAPPTRWLRCVKASQATRSNRYPWTVA